MKDHKKKQLDLLNEIKDIKINIVTCGHCGEVLFHKMKEEEITCCHCNSEMDLSDCPDFLWYLTN